MKFRHLLVSLLAVAAFSATSCQEEEKDLGLPEIKISQNELALDQGVGTTNLNVYATRNWTVSTTADWIAVNPAKGAAYTETNVTVTVLENEGYNRSGTVKFDIGYDSKTLTINQTGAKGEKSEGSGTLEDPYTVKGVIDFIGTLGTETSANAVYIKGKVQAITLKYADSGTYGNARFTMIDEGVNDNVFTAYNVLYLGNKKWTSGKTDIAEGDEVVVCSKVINYNGKTPETSSGGYLYSLNGETGADKAKGSGTLEDPYNPAAACLAVANLTWTSTTDYQTTDPVYVKGKIVKIANNGTFTQGGSFGNASFYITETGEDGTEFYAYHVLYLENKKFETGQTDIKVGDEVIIYGKLMNYKGNTPETASAYVYSLNGVTENTGGTGGGGDTGDVIFSEDLETSQGNFTIDNKSLGGIEKVWALDASYKCMKATGYANSTNYATESWLVSPEIDLTSQTTAFLTFDHAGKYFSSVDKAKEETTLRISADGGNTWDAVVIPTYYALDFKFVSSGEISLASYVGKKIKIAFRYVSTAEKAGTWEVNHVKVYKTSTGGSTGGGGNTTDTFLSEAFETSQGNFTIDNKSLGGAEKVWGHDASYKCMKATGYANSTNYATESWLVSPEVDLTSTTTAYLSFEHAGKYFTDVDKAKAETTLKVSPDGGTTWEAVTIPTYYALDFKFVASGEIDLAKYAGKKIKIAFVYTSTTEKAGTWEVKNVKVYKTSTSGGTTGGGGGTTDGAFEVVFTTNESVTVQGVTFAFAKGEGSTAPAWNTNYNELRLYVKNTISVTSTKDMEKVDFYFHKQGQKAWQSISMTSTEGTFTDCAESTSTDDVKVATWSGTSKAISLVMGEVASGQRVLVKAVVKLK